MADTAPTRFRVHFDDGWKLDVEAANTKAAGEAAQKQRPGIIRKIKIIREK